MTDEFGSARELAVRIGDSLTILVDTEPSEFPLPNGRTFEREAEKLLARVAELANRTRVEWKKKLLELVGQEVVAAQDALIREHDAPRSHQLLQDAELHFRQYEQGVEPKVTFIAGADGSLVKAD